jgi:hypothetical protein
VGLPRRGEALRDEGSSDHEAPYDREFVLLDGVAASGGEASNRWVAKWGYPDLVRDDSHSDALMERDPAALEVLWREFAKRPDWKTPPQT